MARREQDRWYTAKKRALETPNVPIARLEQDKAYTAKKRSLETPSESMARREPECTLPKREQ